VSEGETHDNSNEDTAAEDTECDSHVGEVRREGILGLGGGGNGLRVTKGRGRGGGGRLARGGKKRRGGGGGRKGGERERYMKLMVTLPW
jgi:hypothetical protein